MEVALEVGADQEKHGGLWEGGFGGINYFGGKNISPSVISLWCLSVSMFYWCDSVYNYDNYEICL